MKGKNRYLFEDRLCDQIRYALTRCEGAFEVTKSQGRIFVNALSEFDYEETVENLRTVFGVTGICPVVHVEDEGFEKLCQDVAGYIDRVYPDKNFSFKVEARRARKNYPKNSMEINCDIGEALLNAFPGLRVDVHKPDVMLRIEVREKIYIYSTVIPGPGGLPVGTNGKGMLLGRHRFPGGRLYDRKARRQARCSVF